MPTGRLLILDEASALDDWLMLLPHDRTILWSSDRIRGRQAQTILMHGSTVNQTLASTYFPMICLTQVLRKTGMSINSHVESTYPTLDR